MNYKLILTSLSLASTSLIFTLDNTTNDSHTQHELAIKERQELENQNVYLKRRGLFLVLDDENRVLLGHREPKKQEEKPLEAELQKSNKIMEDMFREMEDMFREREYVIKNKNK